VPPEGGLKTVMRTQGGPCTVLLNRFPYGLLRLIPAVVVLGLRAGSDWCWGQSADEHSRDTTSMLIKDDLAQMAMQSELGAGFLVGLRNQALLEHLKARIGAEVWTKLQCRPTRH